MDLVKGERIIITKETDIKGWKGIFQYYDFNSDGKKRAWAIWDDEPNRGATWMYANEVERESKFKMGDLVTNGNIKLKVETSLLNEHEWKLIARKNLL